MAGGQGAACESGPSTAAHEWSNEGARRWHEQRRGWLSTSGGVKKAKQRRTSSTFLEPSMLATSKPFPKPLPLSEVVEFLLEEWEESGYS